MERKKYFILIITVFLSLRAVASYQEQIFTAYLQGDMNLWKTVIDRMEGVQTKNARFTHNLLNYQYGYIAYNIGVKEYAEARTYLTRAYAHIARLQEMNYNESVIQSYIAAFYGFEIGLQRLKAPIYGPRSIAAANRAMEHDAHNPMGFIQYGHAQYYMPSVFGGSKTEALRYYHTAEKLFERTITAAQRDWNYISLLVTIAQAYEDVGNIAKAVHYYDKILTIVPDFMWVKYELYPAIKEKI